MNVLLWYWGRETSKYTLELLQALRTLPQLRVVLSCSQGSDLDVAARQIPDLPIEPVVTYVGSKKSWSGRLSALSGLAALPQTAWRFHRLLRRHQIDVAICAQSAIWDVAALPLLARGPVRYLQIAHEVVSHPGEGYPLRDRVNLRQIALADGIIVLSDQIRRQIIDRWRYPANRCWKMPHGAHYYGSSPPCPAVHPRGSRPVRVLFFGRIARYKGMARLFAAAEMLRQRGLRFDLTVAGAGDLDPYRPLDAAIEVHNTWLDDDQIAALLANHDFVVLPYELSSQSGVAAVAYSAGRPVVATPIGGLAEQVLPSTGVLARDMTNEAFADAMAQLIDDPELFDRCAEGGLRHAQTALDWHHCAEILNEAIYQVHAMPRRRRDVPSITTVEA